MSFLEGLQHVGRILQAADQDSGAQHNVVARQKNEQDFTAKRDKSLAEITAERDKALADLEKSRADHAATLQELRDKNLHSQTLDTLGVEHGYTTARDTNLHNQSLDTRRFETDEGLRGEKGRAELTRRNLIEAYGPVIGQAKYNTLLNSPVSKAEADESANRVTTVKNTHIIPRLPEVVDATTNSTLARAGADTMAAQNDMNAGQAISSTVGQVARAKQDEELAKAKVNTSLSDRMGQPVPRRTPEEKDAINARRKVAGLPPLEDDMADPITETIRNNAGLNRMSDDYGGILGILSRNPILGRSLVDGGTVGGGVLPNYSGTTVPKKTPVPGGTGNLNFDFSGAKK